MTRSSISTTTGNPRIVLNYLSVVIFPIFPLSRSFNWYGFLCSTFWLCIHTKDSTVVTCISIFLKNHIHIFILFVCLHVHAPQCTNQVRGQLLGLLFSPTTMWHLQDQTRTIRLGSKWLYSPSRLASSQWCPCPMLYSLDSVYIYVRPSVSILYIPYSVLFLDFAFYIYKHMNVVVPLYLLACVHFTWRGLHRPSLCARD